MKKNARRRHIFAAVVLAAVLLSACAAPKTGPVRLKAVVAQKTFVVGENIIVFVKARAAAGTRFRWDPPEIKTAGLTLDDNRAKSAYRPWASAMTVKLLFRSFEPGEHEIPALPVSYQLKGQETWQEATTTPLKITVNNQISGDALKIDIKDIKGPLRRGHGWIVGLVLLLGACAVVIGIKLWMNKKRVQTALPKPALSTHEIALQKIRELLAKDYISRGLEQQFYYELSLIVRHYLEARFAIRAPEMTTEEFLAYLRDSGTLSVPHKELLKDFLTHCDLVKFARYAPGPTEIDAALASARRLIEETKETSVPEASQ